MQRRTVKKIIFLLLALLFLLIIFMFKTKFHISRLENELILLEANISKKSEELNLLEAELNYLIRPSRIEELLPKLEEKLEKKLGKKTSYHSIKPKQIIKSIEIP